MKIFLALNLLWLADMALLAQLGPVGRNPFMFGGCYLLGFLLMFLMVRNCPDRYSDKKLFILLLTVGIIGRIFFISYPVGNDVYRYIWEGYIQSHGHNPYLLPPSDSLLSTLASGKMADIWHQINHKDIPAIYPPLVMLAFRQFSAISSTPIHFKCMLVGLDILVIVTLFFMIRDRGVPTKRLLYYVANPLILVYVAGEAHFDVIQSLFLLTALLFLLQNRSKAGFLLLGAAVCSKYLAIAALPFVMIRKNRAAWGMFLVAFLSFLPYIQDVHNLFRTLLYFGSSMHYNDGIAEVVRFFAGENTPLILSFLLITLLAVVYLFEPDTLKSVYYAIGILLLCLPTLHPWYLIILAPFMVIYPSRAWFYLMMSVIVTTPVLAVEYHTGLFQEIKWLKIIEYVPFTIVLVYDFLIGRPLPDKDPFPGVASISVIIPTLNEAPYIRDVISSAQHHQVKEVIVADGGSSDDTVKRAGACGAKVLMCSLGRGHQVSEAIEVSSGDLILVLHADTRLKRGSLAKMIEAVNKDAYVAGGAFAMRFGEDSFKFTIISFLNNIRANIFGVSFGDQAQFIRRSALDRIGGYPAMMLMEDVELSMRMKRFGRPLFIRQGVLVSARRWKRKSTTGNVFLILALFLRYLFGRRFGGGKRTDHYYYAKYYRTESRAG